MKRALTTVAGVVLIVLGIPGLVLPFLQGVLMIVAGLVLLSSSSPRVRHALETLRERHPALDRRISWWRERLHHKERPNPPPRAEEPDREH